MLAIYQYTTKQYVNSSLLVFFFATSEFQLIPKSIVEALPVRSGDIAILYILSVGFMQFYLGKKRFSFGLEKIDKVWGGYLLLTIALSFLIYNIDLVGIFKTTRHYLLMFSFFLFVNMKTEEIEKLKNKLLYITLGQCILYFCQSLTGFEILNGPFGGGIEANYFGVNIYRCYNIPYLAYYFIFYIYMNPEFKAKQKYVFLSIVCLPLIFCFHRSLHMVVVIALFVASMIITKNILAKTRTIFLLSCLIISLALMSGMKKTTKDTKGDMSSVLAGEYQEIEYMEEIEDRTLLFRVTHLYERLMYLSEDSKKLFFGAGWMHEDSNYTRRNFDFIIGLPDDNDNPVQIDTPDISFSLIFMRVGIIGLLIYLTYIVLKMKFFYRNRDNHFIVASLPYLILLVGTSITSDIFFVPMYYLIVILDKSYFEIKTEKLKNKDENSRYGKFSFDYL